MHANLGHARTDALAYRAGTSATAAYKSLTHYPSCITTPTVSATTATRKNSGCRSNSAQQQRRLRELASVVNQLCAVSMWTDAHGHAADGESFHRQLAVVHEERR